MKLWHKNYETHELIEKFTVGNDYILDKEIILYDCALSIAHAHVLEKIKIISKQELTDLQKELSNIAELARKGLFQITLKDEDGHTAIEKHLTEKLGELGKKIHTGRSRNDQITTAMRLYEKDKLIELGKSLSKTIMVILEFAKKHEWVPMPGRTHLQTGMPSSVGLWATSLVSQLLDDGELLKTCIELCDRCPLGSAASYGVPLDLDRDLSARLLGFRETFVNVLAAQHSRGKLEALIADLCDHIELTLSKFAQDLILFSLPEFGYFTLPNELTTGSSIMPQKKNPDGLELLRSKSALVSGYAQQIKNIIRSSATGYNRDVQDTKEAVMKCLDTTLISILVMELTFKNLRVNEKELEKGFTKDIFATDFAFDLVKSGMPFREAYKKIGLELETLDAKDLVSVLKDRVSRGAPGNLDFAYFENLLGDFGKFIDRKAEIFYKAINELFV